MVSGSIIFTKGLERESVIRIGTLGLTSSEENVIKSICTMTRGRTHGGYVLNTESNVADNHIVVVNVDDVDAAIKWRTLMVAPHPPVIVLYTKEKPADPEQPYLLRPIGPAKLLALLESIASKLHESAEVWKTPSLARTAPAPVQTVTLRALVVDDSPTVCKQLELELGKLNIQVDIAETGERAFELLLLNKYDLFFLDVVLPGVDGYQVCKYIRKNPATKNTPVIMLTSKSSPFDRVRGTLVGCSSYLTKPVDYQAFHEAIGKYVEIGAQS